MSEEQICNCPLCGRVGIFISGESLPKLYCKHCKIAYRYEYQLLTSLICFKGVFKLDSFTKADFCEKHGELMVNDETEGYWIYSKLCSGCKGEIIEKEFKKLKLTNNQKLFIHRNGYEVGDILSDEFGDEE